MFLRARINRPLRLCGGAKLLLNERVVFSSTSQGFSSDKKTVIKPFSEIPPRNPLYRIPYIGVVFFFKPFTNIGYNESFKLMDYLVNKYGDIVQLNFNNQKMVIVSHPDYAKSVMQANYEEHKRFKIPVALESSKKPNAVKDITMLDGKEWAEFRKPAQEKMLRPAVVASYVPLIEKVTNDFVTKLRDKTEIEDLRSHLASYATESVAMLCFNRRLGCLESDTVHPVVPVLTDMFEILQMSIQVQASAKKQKDLLEKYEKLGELFVNVVDKEISSQKTFLGELEKQGKLNEYLDTEPNFMYSLLSDPRVDDEEARSMIMSLFGAGIDTSANTLAFLLTELAMNQDKQEKLYEEIRRIVGNSKSLQREHLAQMSYLKACLKESMRKTFPTGSGVVRCLESDLVIGGYLVPKDIMILVNMKAMTGDQRFFHKPEEFIPERWLRDTTGELAKGRQYPFATKPFGFGARSCLGQRFAETEIYIAVTKIIQNFEISVPPGYKGFTTTLKLFTTPEDKIAIQLKQREQL